MVLIRNLTTYTLMEFKSNTPLPKALGVFDLNSTTPPPQEVWRHSPKHHSCSGVSTNTLRSETFKNLPPWSWESWGWESLRVANPTPPLAVGNFSRKRITYFCSLFGSHVPICCKKWQLWYKKYIFLTIIMHFFTKNVILAKKCQETGTNSFFLQDDHPPSLLCMGYPNFKKYKSWDLGLSPPCWDTSYLRSFFLKSFLIANFLLEWMKPLLKNRTQWRKILPWWSQC